MAATSRGEPPMMLWTSAGTPDYALMSKVDRISQVCHGLNKAWCEQNGDASQKEWGSAPREIKDSARRGVLFHLANPDAGDAASHDAWSIDKIAEGYRYGPDKDPVAKTHPCLVSFDDLPLHQQFKDRLFRTTVHLMKDIL